MKLCVCVLLLVCSQSALSLPTNKQPSAAPATGEEVPAIGKLEDSEDLMTEQQAKKKESESPKAEDPKSNATVVEEADKTANKEPTVHCSGLVSALANSGITQKCTPHEDCMGAVCRTNLLAHNMTYNFTVRACDPPSVALHFKIEDIEGAEMNREFKKTDKITIPKGNMSYPGFYETESSVDLQLDKVFDITHFRLDFKVHYRVLKDDPLKELFSHTFVPMLTINYNKSLCVIPTETEGTDDKYFGIIPKEYVDDKKKLTIIGVCVGFGVVMIIAAIYFIVTRNRRDNFYRTYISTDENRHLTKGNDGFEPLDDSDID